MREVDEIARANRLIALVQQHYPRTHHTRGELHDWNIISLGLIQRSTQTLSAVLALRPGGFFADAAVLVRSIFEYTTAFAWIACDPAKRAPVWVKNDLRQRLATNAELHDVGDPDLIPAATVTRFEQYLASVPGSLPSTVVMAREADDHWVQHLPGHPAWDHRGSFSDAYRITYRFASKFAHPTPMGIRALVTDLGAGRVMVSDTPAEVSPSPFIIGPYALGTGLRVAAVSLGWPTLEQIDDVFGAE